MMIKNDALKALRALMEERKIDGYIIPSGDAHASEYTADYWRSREWVSGFSGSSGVVVVLKEEAGLWTDGRYFIQAERELKRSGINLFKEPDAQTYTDFLAEKLPVKGKLGFDGRMIMSGNFAKLKEALKQKEISYETEDLINLIWKNRPQLPQEKAFEHVPKFAGKSSAEKLSEVRAEMKEKKISAYLITALDCIAWLLNIRGSDIPGTPVVYSYALVMENEAHVFISPEKISAIKLPGFIIHDYDGLPEFLKKLRTEIVFYNPSNTNVLIEEAILNKEKIKPDIIPIIKAVKTELANIKNAFIREGTVMVRMLRWLDESISGGSISEGSVVSVLNNFRKYQPHYLCDSFPTISAYGENAALAHYSSGEIGAQLQAKGFLLVDTGGQYLDGTTDTTRTICLGEATDEMKRDYTLVLKGHIALARAVFLKGTTGSGLDILARFPILESGQNYCHGTGHGVGYCLSVHEGPHNISHRQNSVELTPGMLVTNEPAIYKEGKYGIRTENVLAVTEKEKTPDGVFYAFETLMYCPIDTRAVATEMLTDTERDWLNDYHKKTREILSPYLAQPERDWLERVTEAI